MESRPIGLNERERGPSIIVDGESPPSSRGDVAWGCQMNVLENLGLRQDPFGPADGATGYGVAAPFLVARDRLLAAVHRGDPLTVLSGRPGMGKTLILSLIEQACRADGISVCSIARGDMAHAALGNRPQVLLIDEADTINTATLRALAPGTLAATAPTMVFAAARPALHRISSDVRTTIIDLRPLDAEEARDFLLTRAARAGRLDLFTREALDVLVEAGRGSPRMLRVLAGAAMFQAASAGAKQISPEHASLAATLHGTLFGLPEAEPTPLISANDREPPALTAEAQANVVPLAPRRAPPRRRDSALPFAASVALAALVLPVLFQSASVSPPSTRVSAANAEALPGPVRMAATAFTVAPAQAAVTTAAFDGPFLSATKPVATAMLAPPLIAKTETRLAAVLPKAALPAPVVVADARPAIIGAAGGIARLTAPIGEAGRTLLVDLLAATRLQPAVVASRTDGGKQPAMTEGAGSSSMSVAFVPVAAAVPAPPVMIAALDTSRLVPTAVSDVRATTQTVKATTTQATEIRDTTRAAQDAKSAADAANAAKVAANAATAAKEAAEQAQAAKLAASQAKTAREAADSAKAAAEASKAAKEAAAQAAVAKEAAEQAKAAKEAADQARAAKDAATEAKAAKEAADQAKAAKEAAEQAKAAKEAAEQAKAAKTAAEQAKAAKDAAEQAKAAKEAAEQAKAAKEAAEQAKAAKEAAEQAKAAKEAAEQAKAAKEAAEQAKAAKDAAEQAKAAKDAADQAKAAKEAANQAKAAKDAAEQAKAAKEAADQAKAAKEAAEQAKAAKEAAEQAKAAKEAAEQAKAAKEAAEQAKAAKDAAEQAKAAKAAADAAKAAKDAADAAKAAKPGH